MEVPEIARLGRNFAVMVRIQGPDPKGLKMRRHPFHHHQDGVTMLSVSGLLLPDSLSRTLPILEILRRNNTSREQFGAVVVTVASVVEPFLPVRGNDSNDSTAAQVLYPELIPEACIDVLLDEGYNDGYSIHKPLSYSSWRRARLLALVEVSSSSDALESLVRNQGGSQEISSWGVGWSLISSSNASQSNLQSEDSLGTSQNILGKNASATRIAFLEIATTSLKELPDICISHQQRRGDLIVVIGSPFGILSPLHFLNSISVGAVANCCPDDSSQCSLLMADIRCLPGTEGAPLFDKHGHICGILTKPLRQRGHSTEIQLVIPWKAIATAYCSQPNVHQRTAGEMQNSVSFQRLREASVTGLNTAERHTKSLPESALLPCVSESSVERATRSVVLVTVGNGAWASGILLNSSGLILTNAHLIEPWKYRMTSLLTVPLESSLSSSRKQNNQEEIQQITMPLPFLGSSDLKSNLDNTKKISFINSNSGNSQLLRVRLNHMKPSIWCDAKVIFISKGPMDVAILQLESIPAKLFPIAVDDMPPSPGMKVYVIGHGPLGPRSDIYPHVSSGVIARVVKGSKPLHLEGSRNSDADDSFPVMLETTAAIYPGMSGGVVVNSVGHMIGLVTSNAKHGGGTIIPEMNFSISCAALEPVFKFSVEGDMSALEVLDRPDALLSSIWALKPLPSTEQQSWSGRKSKEGKGSRFAEFLAKRQAEDPYDDDHLIRGKASNQKLLNSKL